MYTKQDLMSAMKEMGIQSTDTVLIHSSMKSIGTVEGGADTVLDVFMEYLSEGLLILPTHTWANMSQTHDVYDPANEPSCVGLLTNLFRKREGVHRSLHPTHSLAAFGKDSINFLKGEDDMTTPCSPDGCYNRLRERNAKILLLGVNHSRNTYLHCVEEVLQVPDRLTLSPVRFQIIMPDGNVKASNMYRHYNTKTAHISQNYTKLEEAFYHKEAAKQVKFGDASCILCDVNQLFQVTEQVLSHEMNCLIELDEIPKHWWR
jgi:aminoglycoside 3-N-acetyltransferase